MLPDLSKLSDEDYKKLSPEQLLQYNKELPKIDYANQYDPKAHPYPRMKYALITTSTGRRLRVATVANAAEERALGDDGFEWADNPLDLGIETAPGAPVVTFSDYEIPIADEPAAEDATAS